MNQDIMNILSPDQRKDFIRMKELCDQLVSPPPALILPIMKIEVGSLPDEMQTVVHRKANSWVRNWKNLMMSQALGAGCSNTGSFGSGYLNIKNTAGAIVGSLNTTIYYPDKGGGFWINEGADSDDVRGIVIGIGTQAETDESFQLDNQIDHGAAAGDMLYHSTVGTFYTWVGGGTRQWTIVFKRYFVNRSGGSITINEVGMIGEIHTSSWVTLVARDKLITPVAIADDKACRVTYTFLSHVWAS